MNAKIVFYTGTGGTGRAAECFRKFLEDAGNQVAMLQLSKNKKIDETKYEILYLLYPVYAFNAPDAVYKWLEGLVCVENIPAVVVSVSGGGEISPNTACRSRTIKLLERKGYKIIYEDMLVMPSNIAIPTEEWIARMLLEVLPEKVKRIVDDVENGIIRRTRPHFIDRVFSPIGKMEKYGARFFGKHIRVSDDCNGCGWCVNNCPTGNILLNSGRPEFAYSCLTCMNCIYGCPKKALKPGIGKLIVLKLGYDLKALEMLPKIEEEGDINKLAKGFLWSGVRKYLKS